MRNTKLIFVEGLPGLGKTTTASKIASRLQSNAIPVNFLMEKQPAHPLNVGGDLHPAGDTPGKVFFHRYTPDSFVEESIKRWKEFAATAIQAQVVNVLDSYPFQNSIRVLMQMDATNQLMSDYASQVESLVLPMQPVLIYFNQPDMSLALSQMREISALRGQEWTDYVTELVTSCPYAEARHLTGFDGVLAFLSDYKDLLDSLLRQSRIPRLILENCHSHWDACHAQIATFLELST